jgi:GT2 family glycosyltransferase
MEPVSTAPSSRPRTYILLLNWNGWGDTIECLESLFRLRYPNYRVVVCDNGSDDGSMDRIRAWAEGRLDPWVPPRVEVRNLTMPTVEKPIPYREYGRASAETGGEAGEDPPLVLIQTGKNLGFAGGNNVGLRYGLAKGDLDYAWILNNDTVCRSDALDCMVRRMEQKSGAGFCGSTILFYSKPVTVHALGGATYNRWLGSNRHLGLFLKYPLAVDEAAIEKRMKYVVGASMLVSRRLLEDVGLMCEDYFLYFEELDWATRAGGRYSLAYASGSVVYHKEGGSIGTGSDPMEKSFLSDYHSLRNRLIFTRKHHPMSLPTVWLGLFVALVNRLRRGQKDRARMILRLIRGKDAPDIPSSVRPPAIL